MNPNLFWLITAILLAFLGRAEAQQPTKIPRIGFVSAVGSAKAPGPHLGAFRQGLRDLGYAEGKNIVFELRYVEGRSDRVPSLVAELVQLKVDVLVLRSQPAILAAKEATKTIPIVISTTQDSVAAGFVDSLARPGGNITGVTTLQRELSGKRLELLKEVVPGVSRVAALASAIQAKTDFKLYEAPARALKLELQLIKIEVPKPDLDAAFLAAAKGHANALITVAGSVLNRPDTRKRIAELAIETSLPSMHESSDFVEGGGLLSYASDEAESFRRVAYYVDKILKGAKPGDLPVEQAKKFELTINLKTAKQIGLTIPPNVLARADKVIK
jgi:putative ABC transport system substrate-binding protein